MALSHLFGKDRTLGIDIGSAFTKIIELEPGNRGYRVTRAITHPTPPTSCHDGLITDPAAVTASIKEATRGADIHATGAAAAVAGSQVLVRAVNLPQMTESVLRKSIRFEAAKYISANVDDSLVEFEVLRKGEPDGQMQVMLVAAPRDLVEARAAAIDGAGMEATVVDVEAFALQRSLIEFSSDTSLRSESVALVDMGAGHTDLNIVCQGEFALTRNIPIAGSSLTQAIKSLIGCSEEEAESLKLNVRIGPRLVEDGVPPDENMLKAARAIQPLLDELLREIRRSLHYHQQQYPEGSPQAVVSRMLLSGGTSRMTGLPEYVAAKLGLRATLVNVLQEGVLEPGTLTDQDAEKEGPLYAVAAGLALKGQSPQQFQAAA